MARRFAKVSEEETEEAFFYPSDLVNTKTTIPSGSVKCGGYTARRFASRYNSTTTTEIRKSDDVKILSLNYFMLFAFNVLNWYSKPSVAKCAIKNCQSLFFFH